MKKTKEFNFSKARRATAMETHFFRKAIENTFQIKRPMRGRPKKHHKEKYKDIHIKIHPKALKWARSEAHKRKVGYQTIINEVLIEHAS